MAASVNSPRHQQVLDALRSGRSPDRTLARDLGMKYASLSRLLHGIRKAGLLPPPQRKRRGLFIQGGTAPIRPIVWPKHGECLFPIGEVRSKRFRFCCEPAVAGCPYCAGHMAVAYVKREKAE